MNYKLGEITDNNSDKKETIMNINKTIKIHSKGKDMITGLISSITSDKNVLILYYEIFSPFSQQILYIDQGGCLTIHDCAKNQDIQIIKANSTWLTSVDIEKQDGKKVALGTLDNKILIFEVNKSQQKTSGKNFNQDKPIYELMAHSGAINCLQFISSNFLVAGGSDAMVSVWDLENAQRPIGLYSGQHHGDIQCMNHFDLDPNIILTGSSDITTKIWDLRIKNPVQMTFRGHESTINTVKFMPFPDPTSFATGIFFISKKLRQQGSDDSTIQLHDIRMKDSSIGYLIDQNQVDGINQICFSQSGRILFAATENKNIKCWDVLGKGSALENIPTQIKQGHVKFIDLSVDGFALGYSGSTLINEVNEIYYAY